MTYGPMASKIHCCATSQLYTYVKLKPLAGTQGPQVYSLQWCLKPWEYWQQRIYPRYRYAFHHQVAIHQITSWHLNLLGYFLGNNAFHFFMLKWYQKDVSNSLRHYSLGQGQCVGVDLRGGSLFRWLSQGAKGWWGQHGRANHFQGGRGRRSAKWWIVKIWQQIVKDYEYSEDAVLITLNLWKCLKQDSSGTYIVPNKLKTFTRTQHRWGKNRTEPLNSLVCYGLLLRSSISACLWGHILLKWYLDMAVDVAV